MLTSCGFLGGSKEKLDQKYRTQYKVGMFDNVHFAFLPSTSLLLLQIALGSGDTKMMKRGSQPQGVHGPMGETMTVPSGQGQPLHTGGRE